MLYRRSIPLNLLTVSEDGKSTLDNVVILDQREMTLSLDTSSPFKLNADNAGFCE